MSCTFDLTIFESPFDSRRKDFAYMTVDPMQTLRFILSVASRANVPLAKAWD